MCWANLLFVHWRVDPGLMRRLVPEPLELDLFDGSAWVGLVPFRMEDCSFRGVPPLPGLRNFYECNVRTYAKIRGTAGVWFFSLDAQTLLPVIGGRRMWNLNYIYSDFRVERRKDGVTDYRLKRRRGPWAGGSTHVAWRTLEPLPRAAPGSLEHFLTERYWLFTQRRGAPGVIAAGEVRHAPWSLARAELVHIEDTLISAAGIQTQGPPMVMAGGRMSVEGFGLRTV